MNNDEAIRKLQKLKSEYLEEWVDYSGVAEAFDMAIEALHREEAEEKGWCHRIRPKNVEVVVRCKDCRYLEEYRKDAVPVGEVAVYRTMQGWRCMRFPTIYSFVEKEDFCSYGERKGGDDE